MTASCLQQRVAALGNKAARSMWSVFKSFEYLGGVLIQDALELAEQAPVNDVYALLLADARFMCAPKKELHMMLTLFQSSLGCTPTLSEHSHKSACACGRALKEEYHSNPARCASAMTASRTSPADRPCRLVHATFSLHSEVY